MRPLRLCHLSDPHVSCERPGSLAVLDFLLGHARERGADHVLITGDVVDRPRARDLQAVVALFSRHGLWDPSRLTVLPGNHDVSGHPGEGGGPARRRRARKRFLEVMAPVNREPGGRGRLAPGRPLRKRLGPLDLLALVTASDHHDVEGRVEDGDLGAFPRLWPGDPGRLTRMVAVHQHPYTLPVGQSAAWGRFIPEGLEGGEALLGACARHGVRYLLHGHLHTAGVPFDRTVRGVRVRCQGTAKGERVGGRRRWGYDLYTLGGARLTARRYFFDSDRVVEDLLSR